MDMKDFTYLIVLAEEGSISKAADRLFMAQSSLSQFLQQAEWELGVKLFIRTTRGIRPTSNGLIYIEHLKRLLAEYQRVKNELLDNEHMKGGKVTLGISSFRGRRMLPKILMSFYQKYPDVKVEIVEENILKLEDLLLNGELDLAIVAMNSAKLKNEVTFLKRDEVLIVVHKDHPAMSYAIKKPDSSGYWIDLADAARYPFILSDYDTILGNLSRGLFKQAHLPYEVLQENITAAMAVSMASEGLGLAFTYYSYAEPGEHTEFLSVGEEGVYFDIGLARPSNEYHSGAAKALEEVIRSVYQNT